MANVYAVKTGNWSDTTVWNTGALPTSSDDVYSNTFTVTVDINTTVLSIRNTGASGISAGGGFTVSASTLQLNADIIAGITNCLSITNTSPSAVITINTSSGTIQGGSNSNSSIAINVSSSFSGVVNIIGNPTGGAGGHGVVNPSLGTANVTGNVTAGSYGGVGIFLNGAGIINITGTIFSGCVNSSTGTLNVTGTIYGGGLSNNSTGVITHVGSAIASNNNPAIISSNAVATVILSGPFFVSPNGTHAVYCFNWKWQDTSPTSTYYQIRSANLSTIRPLYTADSVGGNPAVANVRSGTVYGPAGELTGTCAVPGASSVLSGVPVDNTTGTATVSAASIRSALGMASANLDTQLAAIPTTPAPTVTAIRTELDTNSTKLANLDATVSSRLSPSGTLARVTLTDTATTLTNAPTVPTANQIASQVRTELTPELSRVSNCATVATTGQQIQDALS